MYRIRIPYKVVNINNISTENGKGLDFNFLMGKPRGERQINMVGHSKIELLLVTT